MRLAGFVVNDRHGDFQIAVVVLVGAKRKSSRNLVSFVNNQFAVQIKDSLC